jgi:sirohydrochlorin cobaltochelatase
VPGMLFAAGHAKNDIPSVLNTYAAANDLKIDYGKELGIDPKMMRAAADRVQEALDTAGPAVPKHETLLVVVGRGASDPDANSNVSKVTRLLWEGFGFGWAETTDAVAARHPEIEFIKAGYLNDHPQVIATFQERIEQILTGDIAMNCQMCKYRTQVLGFEAEVGAVQESHHHHVEGIGTAEDCEYCDGVCNSLCKTMPRKKKDAVLAVDLGKILSGPVPHHHDHGDHHHPHGHDHGHDHEHGHTHAPYPHADHPLGPRSMLKK